MISHSFLSSSLRSLLPLRTNRPCLSFVHTSAVSGKQTLYQVLGVDHHASESTIKEAFIKLSKEKHPDLNPGNVSQANEEFRQLAAAYEILSNKESRKEYDNSLGIRRVRPKHGTRKKQYTTYPNVKPSSGVPPEFGRRVDVDLSRERMARAWEAYKLRWAMEEERLRELEEKKLALRQKIDKARATGFANMTLEEIEALKENMRLMRTPERLMQDNQTGSSGYTTKDKSCGADNSEDRDERFKRPPHTNDKQERMAGRKPLHEEWDDPLMQGIPRESSFKSTAQSVFEDTLNESRKNFRTFQENWKQARFFEGQSGGVFSDVPSRQFKLSLNKVFVAITFGFSVFIIVLDSVYKNDYMESNQYLKSLKEKEKSQEKTQG